MPGTDSCRNAGILLRRASTRFRSDDKPRKGQACEKITGSCRTPRGRCRRRLVMLPDRSYKNSAINSEVSTPVCFVGRIDAYRRHFPAPASRCMRLLSLRLSESDLRVADNSEEASFANPNGVLRQGQVDTLYDAVLGSQAVKPIAQAVQFEFRSMYCHERSVVTSQWRQARSVLWLPAQKAWRRRVGARRRCCRHKRLGAVLVQLEVLHAGIRTGRSSGPDADSIDNVFEGEGLA